MFKNTVYFLSMLCALLINFSVMAAAPKTYPPYPDVWGYDLSTLPAIKYGAASVSAHPMKNGDIWFLVTKSYKIKPSMESSEEHFDKKYLLIKFFKNEQIELSEKERIKLFKIIDKDGDHTTYSYDPMALS